MIEQDKARSTSTRRGLFGGRFRHPTSRRSHVIRDDEDGVDRCPHCTWEIQDGWCEGCGYMVEDDWSDDGSGFTDDLSDLDHDALDQHSYEYEEMYGLPDGYIDDDAISGNVAAQGRGSRPPYHYDGVQNVREVNRRGAQGRRRGSEEAFHTNRRVPVAPHELTHSGSPRRNHEAYPDEDVGDEAMYLETEHYDSEGDYAGSLDDFIDNDGEGRQLSITPTTLSLSDTDSMSGRQTGYDLNGLDARFSPLSHDVDSEDHESYRAERDGFEEVDQGSINNRRLRRYRRRIVSDDESSIGRSASVGHESSGPRRTRHGHHYDSSSHGGSSQQMPIEIDSDSEPVPMSRVRRRRVAVDGNSDDETPRQSHYSQSPSTLHQAAPMTSLPEQSRRHSQSQRQTPPSAVLIGSSPARTTSAAGANTNGDGRGSPLTDYPSHMFQPRATSLGRDHSSDDDLSSIETMTRAEAPGITEVRRLPAFTRRPAHRTTPHSPLYRSNRPRSRTPLSPASHSRENVTQTGPNTLRLSAQRDDRAAYKEQRRSAKLERRRRNQAHVDAGESRAPRLDGPARRNDAYARRWN